MSNPEFERRFRAAKAEIQAAGMKASAAKPPLFALLSALGFRIRPPHYQGLLINTLIMGAFFGFFFTSIMYLIAWQTLPQPRVVILGLIAGLLFGIPMAALTRWQSKRKKFSRWEDL